MKNRIIPTNQEKVMRDNDFIVSKTDISGRITYGNEIFIEYSGYSEQDLLGKQHNIIRHPDMPRGVFKFLWDNIATGKEVFAYVKNMAKDGSYYWVLANVTPDYDSNGKIEEILSHVKLVTDIMFEISAASSDQSAGINQVSQAISQ